MVKFPFVTEKLNTPILTLSFGSFLIGFVYVLFFGVNIPVADEWNNIDFIRKIYNHEILFSDFFQQLNEHRILLVRILIWLQVWIITYSSKIQMILTTIVISFAIFVYLKYCFNHFKHSKLLFIIPIPLLFISTRQYENLLWGIQLNAVISYLFPVFCFYLFSKIIESTENLYRNLFTLIVIGVFAGFSQINGLFLWPVLLFYSLLFKRDIRVILPIFFFGILSFIIYFWSYTSPSYHPDAFTGFNLLDFMLYYINLLGGSIFYKTRLAFIFGLFLIVVLTFLFFKLIHEKKVKQNIFPVLVLTYCLITIGIISFGRSSFDLETSMFSRYTTISLLFLTSVYVLIIELNIFSSRLKNAIPLVLIVLLILSNYRFIRVSYSFKEERLLYVSLLNDYQKNPTELKRIFNSETFVIKQIEYSANYKPLYKLTQIDK